MIRAPGARRGRRRPSSGNSRRACASRCRRARRSSPRQARAARIRARRRHLLGRREDARAPRLVGLRAARASRRWVASVGMYRPVRSGCTVQESTTPVRHRTERAARQARSPADGRRSHACDCPSFAAAALTRSGIAGQWQRVRTPWPRRGARPPRRPLPARVGEGEGATERQPAPRSTSPSTTHARSATSAPPNQAIRN